MPAKAAQTTLPFTRNTGRVRETSPTDSDALLLFAALNSMAWRTYSTDRNQYLLLNLDIATKLDQSQNYEPLETALATTYSRPSNA
jgi:hypothetical protein